MIAEGTASWALALLLLLLALLASPAQSDTGAARRSAETKKLCYCGCDAQPEAKMCEHMCDLPKYENRWWASSCHKPKREDSKQASPAPPVRSKRNRNEQALLK